MRSRSSNADAAAGQCSSSTILFEWALTLEEAKGEELLNAGRSASHSRLNLALYSPSPPTPSPSQSGITVLAARWCPEGYSRRQYRNQQPTEDRTQAAVQVTIATLTTEDTPRL